MISIENWPVSIAYNPVLPIQFNINPRESKFLWAPTCRWKLYNKRKYKYKINHSSNLAPSFCVITETDQLRLLITDIGLYDDNLHKQNYNRSLEYTHPTPGENLICIKYSSDESVNLNHYISRKLLGKYRNTALTWKIIFKTKKFCKLC